MSKTQKPVKKPSAPHPALAIINSFIGRQAWLTTYTTTSKATGKTRIKLYGAPAVPPASCLAVVDALKENGYPHAEYDIINKFSVRSVIFYPDGSPTTGRKKSEETRPQATSLTLRQACLLCSLSIGSRSGAHPETYRELESMGMIEQGRTHAFEVTEKGLVFLQAIESLPLPVETTSWVMPTKD